MFPSLCIPPLSTRRLLCPHICEHREGFCLSSNLPSSNLLSLPHIHPAFSTSLLSHPPGVRDLGWLQCVSVTQHAFGSTDSTHFGQQTGTGRNPGMRPDRPLGGGTSVTSRALTPCFFPSVCHSLSLSNVLFT